MIYENFNNLDENCVVPLPKGNCLGGHALLLTGYSNETRLFKVQNSWGADWGDGKGCCFMKYEHVLNPEWSNEYWIITKE